LAIGGDRRANHLAKNLTLTMKILLVGNYLIDRQESMQRFTNLLAEGLIKVGHEVRVIRPEPFWVKLTPAFASGLAKWFGYLDKFVAFPIALNQSIAWADLVHICDHSNAFYTKHLQSCTPFGYLSRSRCRQGGIGRRHRLSGFCYWQNVAKLDSEWLEAGRIGGVRFQPYQTGLRAIGGW
jgi:hypothetical protein